MPQTLIREALQCAEVVIRRRTHSRIPLVSAAAFLICKIQGDRNLMNKTGSLLHSLMKRLVGLAMNYKPTVTHQPKRAMNYSSLDAFH